MPVRCSRLVPRRCALPGGVSLHLQTCFKYLGYELGQFPEAERASKEILALPSYPELPTADQERVVDNMVRICREMRQVQPLRRAA